MNQGPGQGLGEYRGIGFLQFDVLRELGAAGFFTTRLGGVSGGPYSSLNLGLQTGDDPEKVDENRRKVESWLVSVWDGSRRTSGTLIAVPGQVHKTEVAVVTRPPVSEAVPDGASPYAWFPGKDALVTRDTGIILSALFADCVPVYLVDPVTPAVGLVHAGWRGTLQLISAVTVAAMAGAFGTMPGQCFAILGPSIGPCCYRTGEEVADRFEERFGSSVVTRTRRGTFVNLWESNSLALVQAGVARQSIVPCRTCTSCAPALFYSHRASGGTTGRMGAYIWLL